MIDQPIQYLKGVGPKRATLLGRLGIFTVRDLLAFFPREYDDRRMPAKIATVPSGRKATLSGKVEAAEVLSLGRALSLFKVAISDGTGIAFALFYRAVNPYHRHDVFAAMRQAFARGNSVVLSGTCEQVFGQKQIKVEEYDVGATEDALRASPHFYRIVPFYPLTEGIHQKWLRELVTAALEHHGSQWPDILPGDPRENAAPFRPRLPAGGQAPETVGGGEMSAPEAVREIHFPLDFSRAERARRRLAYDEFLLLETAMAIARRSKKTAAKPFPYRLRKHLLTPFREKLAFGFTPAQKKVINEIFDDLRSGKAMNRLLLGDVGSGKTVVALSAMLLAVENGWQVALLAPTEILAEQHAITLRQMLDGLPVNVALLTGRLSGKTKERQRVLREIAEGAAQLVVGTHALLEKRVQFRSLSLIVIDEQHRFGVIQRAALQEKTRLPDVLVMTATPIPRTLALTLYGDMDVSVIDRPPPGRKPVRTLHLDENAAYAMVKEEVKKGRQAYIVYPLVEESDKVEMKAAVKEAETLSASVFRDFRVGLLHGQMPPEQKQSAMLDFREKKYDVLIATTVIEAGIDIPNATLVVIEHADRFGLATLHQLRGRVGRGSEQSFCLLIGTPGTEEARKRIEVMLSTGDGFAIAEEDLRLRGPGELLGTAQHGIPELKAGNLISDARLIEEAREHARRIIEQDPRLLAPPHAVLRTELSRLYRGRLGLLNVG